MVSESPSALVSIFKALFSAAIELTLVALRVSEPRLVGLIKSDHELIESLTRFILVLVRDAPADCASSACRACVWGVIVDTGETSAISTFEFESAKLFVCSIGAEMFWCGGGSVRRRRLGEVCRELPLVVSGDCERVAYRVFVLARNRRPGTRLLDTPCAEEDEEEEEAGVAEPDRVM